jgi:hypothetical protein
MDSMAEAMKEALEHPIPEPPHRPRLTWKPKASVKTPTTSGSGYFWWGLIGSLAAAALLRRGTRRTSDRRAQALAAMDFGGD